VAALLATATARFVGGRGGDAWRVWQRDAAAHPSPNAGPVEAAFAGALGVRLGGVNRYDDSEEDRGVLDGGREVRVRDLRRAVTLSRAVSVSALAVAVVVAARVGGRRG
jgi:adenosylcobinamide-phosphate synthase